VHVVPLGVDTQRFAHASQPEETGRDEVFRVIFVGQISPFKGLHYLVGGLRMAGLPRSELLVLGSIKDADYARRVLSTRDVRIRLLGHVPQIELRQWYRRADVFVLPSISDGFALVVAEAMTAGLPVIVSENVGARDLIRDGIDGFSVPIRSAETLAEKITWLYEHPEERAAMGIQARQRVQEFTWGRYGERLLDVYRQIEERETP
jgi:glycosyltransferase involved in cell wall biosynthesis